jgi:hypothetical protein
LFCEPAAFGFFASCPTAAVDLNSDGIDELVVFAGDASDPALGHAHTMVLGETGFDIANTLDMGQLRVEANDLNANPTRALVADLDGDGLRDILVDGVDVLASTSVLLAFYNNGNGTLTAPVTVPIPNIVREVALIELDGDPQVEIAVGTEISLDFWEATGERTLVPIEGEIEIRGVPPEPLHVVSGDVDGDGVQDLVMAGFYRFAVLRGIPITP